MVLKRSLFLATVTTYPGRLDGMSLSVATHARDDHVHLPGPFKPQHIGILEKKAWRQTILAQVSLKGELCVIWKRCLCILSDQICTYHCKHYT